MVAKQGPALVWVWADVACGGVAGFKTHVAVALSNMTIMAGALVNLGFNLTKKHPHLDRPLIDWDLILIMEPTTILGALAGSYLNKVKPTLISGKKSRGEKRERKNRENAKQVTLYRKCCRCRACQKGSGTRELNRDIA